MSMRVENCARNDALSLRLWHGRRKAQVEGGAQG